VLGIINASPFVHFRAELVACLPFLLYFPIKETVRKHEIGGAFIALATIGLGLYAVARNGLLMQQALANADQVWKIADVRYNYGETFLAAALLITLGFLSVARNRRTQVMLVGAMGLLVAGLLLTKSRAFWVATCLGFVVAAYLLRPVERKRLLALATVGALSFVVIATLVFGDYVALLLSGIVRRFSTLATATTSDVSLVNRFVETSAVMDRVWRNPILGYGWGAPIAYYSIVQIATVQVAFVHNGYAALWLKVGVWGLGLMLAVWAGALVGARQAARALTLTAAQRAIAAGAGGTLITFSVAALTSNPFTIPDQLLAVTLVLGMLHGLAQRADSASRFAVSDGG
jgi:O-antigen ligase